MSSDHTPIRDAPDTPRTPGQAGRDLSGRTLGDFRVERLLGRGGMGEVYLAHQISLKRHVALKVLKPELVANPKYLDRFEKEAHSAAQLNHPNIVHIYSFGDFAGLKYIAMEYVEGLTLKDQIVKQGAQSLPVVLNVLRQTAQALAAAAEMGLVHRDIKPENLLLTRKGQAKVADFGLCQMTTGVPSNITQEGTTLGTPMYMSPEQVQGRDLDRRSDLYSLGVTAYHMLAGTPPFTNDAPVALALKHLRETPPSLAVHRPDLPESVVKMVMRLMEKDPAKRYQSAELLLKDLSRIKAEVAAGATGDANAATSGGPLAPSTAHRRPRTEAPRFSFGDLGRSATSFRLGLRTIGATLALAVLAGGGLGFLGRSENLLARQTPGATRSPGLWIASWEAVPQSETPSAQYRFAQIDAAESQRVAAWLAVPGRFPTASDWGDRAYVQLIRTLLRHRDAHHLDALASELRTSRRSSAELLSHFAIASSAALRGKADEVLSALDSVQFDRLDPGLAALGFELSQTTRRSAVGLSSSLTTRLDRLTDQAADSLQIAPFLRLGLFKLD
jgi:serine/threonine-protein kinase